MASQASMTLKPGREKPLRQKHPWVFSGAVAKEPKGDTLPGSIIDVLDHQGRFLAKGAYSPKSQIRCRVLSWDPNEPCDSSFVLRKIQSAAQKRQWIFKENITNSARLIFSESDGLPGVIIDQYGDYFVLQLLTVGAEQMRSSIVNALKDYWPAVRGIFERSDDHSRDLEGLPKVSQTLFGEVPASGLISILEEGIIYQVDVLKGHKTGFYLDQRDSRRFIREHSRGLRVLNCFCYTGGFSLAAAMGGAREVVSIDSSGNAIELAKKNAESNGLSSTHMSWIDGDVFDVLRDFRKQGELFDIVILDPPKFANNAGQLTKATRAYKELIMQGLSLLQPNGRLAAFSCSGLISDDLFQKVAFGAALDVGVSAQVIHKFMQADCHPILLTFPESSYLKGLWLIRE